MRWHHEERMRKFQLMKLVNNGRISFQILVLWRSLSFDSGWFIWPKARLLENGKSCIQEIGIPVGEAQVVVVENTPQVHNLITCTLCSCYPRSILGQPPSWYISKAYRARSVREPRSVLAEFGLELPSDIQLIVHDSNADMRYLVLPQAPENIDDIDMKTAETMVTRDHLIGVRR